jgi:hypothetical protein
MTATIIRTAGRYEVHYSGMIYGAGTMAAAKQFCKSNQFKIAWGV